MATRTPPRKLQPPLAEPPIFLVGKLLPLGRIGGGHRQSGGGCGGWCGGEACVRDREAHRHRQRNRRTGHKPRGACPWKGRRQTLRPCRGRCACAAKTLAVLLACKVCPPPTTNAVRAPHHHLPRIPPCPSATPLTRAHLRTTVHCPCRATALRWWAVTSSTTTAPSQTKSRPTSSTAETSTSRVSFVARHRRRRLTT